MNMLLVHLLLLAAAALVANAAPPKMSAGEWLAKELGMDTGLSAQEALSRMRAQGHLPTFFASKKEPVDPQKAQQAEQLRQPYLKLLKAGKPAEALETIDGLIKEKAGQANDVAHLRLDRVEALQQADRYIEALVEAQRLKQLLRKLNQPLQLADQLTKQVEQKLDALGNYHKLQVPVGASQAQIRKAYKGLMLMLHPDKIGTKLDLDDSSKQYIQQLFNKVQEAHARLTA